MKRSAFLTYAGALPLCLLTMLAMQQRVAADTFPAAPTDEPPQISVGVFRIMVAPEAQALLKAQNVGGTSYNGYNGYHNADGRLTSPMLIDFNTAICTGARHPRHVDLGDWPWFSYFLPNNVPPGDPIGTAPIDYIQSYDEYAAVPADFENAVDQTEEILTEITNFCLKTWAASQCTNAMAPQFPLDWPMVMAGYSCGYIDKPPRTIGMVQERTDPPNAAALGPADPDFKADSFFDVYVLVNLPPLASTYSGSPTAVPPVFPAAGCVLYNKDPLIITNRGITRLPPDVIYMHGGNTNAVDLYFKYDNHPYWSADDYFGSMVLAGHMVLPYDDCYYEQAAVTDTLGTPGASAPEMPPEFVRASSLYPTPGATYDVVKLDTNPPVASYDLVTFNVAGTTYYARNLSLGKLSNSIALPPPGMGAACTSTNGQMTLQLSKDGINYYSLSPTGAVQLSITNYSSEGNVCVTKVVQMNLKGSWPFGSIYLRQRHSTNSPGQHTLRSSSQGYKVSSFFDVYTEISTDNSNWYPANRPVRMLASAPAPRPRHLYIDKRSSSVVLSWFNSFPLQTTTNLTSGTWTVVTGVTNAPYTNDLGTTARFFRLATQ